jgi:CRP/FNR family nitrogen fixation transcriptional regulator
LLDLWKRGGKNDALVILMNYLDVADYLGMQIETLSRLITAMEREGTIERSLTPKTLILRNRELISLLAS